MNPNTLGLQIFISIAGFASLLTAGILVFGFTENNSLAFWLFGAAAAWPAGQIVAHGADALEMRRQRRAT